LHRSSLLTISAISCALFGLATVKLNSHFFAAEAAAQPQAAQTAPVTVSGAKALQIKPVSETITTTTTAKTGDIPQPTNAPGTAVYVAKRGDTLPSVAHAQLKNTAYLTSSELGDAIRAANNLGPSNFLKPGQEITIPGVLAAPVVEHSISVPKDFEVRAIYLTGIMAASDHGIRIIKHWREVGGNAVVFDIKDSDGSVNIPFEHPLLGNHHVYIHDLPKFVHFLHSENMHAIARVAIFRDERLVTEHTELAVQSRKNHGPWRENGKLVWTDSSNPKVQDYNIALAKFVAQSGADEIQFDYVRFPAEGDQKDASFVFQNDRGATDASSAPATTSKADNDCGGSASLRSGGTGEAPVSTRSVCKDLHAHIMQRSDVITAFLKKAYAELHPTGALLSLDVFGVMAWQRPVDLSHTGQDIVGMAKYCDVLSPMIYPSHFFGMDNIEHPGDAPEHFIGESMERFELITKGSGVTIRPWLQAFHWRTKTYSPEYIKVQVATAREKGGIGFLFWNAANDYSKPYEAMPEMKAADMKAGANPKYFRGDELPGVTVRAALTSPAN